MNSSLIDRLVVCCADIGSIPNRNFGWFRVHGGATESSTSIDEFALRVADDLAKGRPVALGFECPLFVPVRDYSTRVAAARDGEGDRPWSASAGANALATGLTQTIFVLKAVRASLAESVPVHFDWNAFAADGGLFLWEAFVSKAAKAQSHTGDAEMAVRSFLAALPDPDQANAIHEPSVHSLIGAALLRTGWTADLSVLSQSCLVIRA